MVKAIPLHRLARPEEVAAARLFFASDDTSFITGQVLSVSGVSPWPGEPQALTGMRSLLDYEPEHHQFSDKRPRVRASTSCPSTENGGAQGLSTARCSPPRASTACSASPFP
jgi:hypothetical protein